MHSLKRKPINTINVTPFVDVMLVLLIIFMSITPMIGSNIDVNLPESDVAISDDNGYVNSIIITLTKENSVFIDEKLISLKDLQFELLKKYSTDNTLLIKGDKDVFYSEVILLMSELKKAGFNKISLIVESNEIKSKI